MFRIKLLFLLLPLVINVKAVEIINERYGHSEPRWYESSSPTPFVSNKSHENTTPMHEKSLDSSVNFSRAPLRHVPKPISYGSFGIAKVIHTTPVPKHEAEAKYYVNEPSSEKLYSEKVSGAPLRFVSTQLPPLKREELMLRDDVVRVIPKPQNKKHMAQNSPKSEYRLYDSLPQSKSVEHEIRFKSTASAPLRHVPKSYGSYEVPRKTTTTYRPDFDVTASPSIEEKIENISKMPLTKSTSETPVTKPDKIVTFEEPTLNVKVIEVTPKPKHNKDIDFLMQKETSIDDNTIQPTPMEVKNELVEHVTSIPMRTMSQVPRLSSFTILPTTVTMMHPTGSPPTTASIVIHPQAGVTIYNPGTSNTHQKILNQDAKELRLDFTCDGINAFYSIDKNCDKFVECKDNVAKLFRCPPGLHFNPRTVWPAEPCEDKYVVGCDKSLASTVNSKPNLIIIALQLDYNCVDGDGYYSHESNCRMFIDCKDNVATLSACPLGWHFNNKTKHDENPCDIPSIAQCDKPEPKFSADLVSKQVDNYVCSSKNGYFKIINECEHFIKCERSIPSLHKCFAGLQFNKHALWENDPCGKASEIRCQVTNTHEFSASPVDRVEDYVCPSSHGYYKIDNECERFIMCENSIATMFKCFPGFQYNFDAEWGEDPCASASIVRCRGKNIPPEPKFSAVLIGKIGRYTCPRNHGYYKQGDSCEKFIKCERSVAFSYKCFHGLQFNHNAQWGEDPCASESIIRCRHSSIVQPAPKFSAVLIARIEKYVCPSNNGYFRIENDCQQFIKCERSIASKYRCFSGLQYNYNAAWGEDPCASESLVRCHAKIIPPAPKFSANLIGKMENYICQSSNGYYSLDNDCEQFIKCERSVASKYKCFSGLQYNHNAVWGADPCARASIVRCRGKNIPPEPKFSAILIGRIEGYACPTNRGYYKHGDSCEEFIKCERAIAFSYKCFSGLQFNHNAQWGEDPCASESIIRCHKNDIIQPAPKFSAVLIAKIESYVCPSSSGYFRIDNDCEQFIKCEHSTASKYRCFSGLQYNYNAAWGEDPCASESLVRCHAKIIPPAPKFSANLIAKMENYICQSSNGYYSLDNDCEQFIKCERSVASKYKCFSGLQFNHNAAWGADPCASKSLIRCHAKVLPPEPKFSATLIARLEGFNCPSNQGYYKHENKCEEFIKCERAIAYFYKCFSGLQFNHNAEWGEDPCASESVIRCKATVIPPALKFSAVLIGRVENYLCPSSSGYFKLENDCEQFIKCERSIASKYKCFSGLQYDYNAAWGQDPCASESVVRCHVKIVPPAPKFSAVLIARMENYVCPSSSGYFKLENDCEQFVKCERSIASKYKCFNGLQFNQNALWGQDPCASESVVRCHIKVIPPSPKFSATLISRMDSYVCPSSSGYFRIENDCEQFIKCERSVASKYKCFPGMQFNHDAAWWQDPCASASIIRCSAVVIPPVPKFSAVFIARVEDYSCPSNTGYYRMKDNCEQFIKCERSIASLYKCNSGLQYNPNAAWGEDPCASESIIRCRAKAIPPAPKFSAILIAELEDYVCPASNGYYRLATNNCEQFIMCESYVASMYKCYPGLHFNHNARLGEDPCVLPAIAHCEIEVVTPAILITPKIDHYTCETANGYFKKPDECEQFIECKRNVPSLYKCPAGLQFNPKARWGENPCASAHLVRCQVKILSYILITKHMTGFTCPAPTGYYKVKDQCGQFIMCQDNQPSLYMCKNGLHFNRYVTWGADPCAIKSVAGCEHYKPKTPLDHDALCPRPNGYFPLDSSECSKYVVCENGVATIMPCPSGLVFNATLEACDWPVNVPSCNPNVFEGFNCPAPMAKDGTYDEQITHYRYGESCKMYIACQEGRPRLLSCDPGRYFDEETRHCIDSSLVHNCKEDSSSLKERKLN